MLEPMHSLVANYGIVEVYVQVRAEGPMEHMPRASVATPWVSRVGAVAPCKVGCSKSEYLTRPIFVYNVLKM